MPVSPPGRNRSISATANERAGYCQVAPGAAQKSHTATGDAGPSLEIGSGADPRVARRWPGGCSRCRPGGLLRSVTVRPAGAPPLPEIHAHQCVLVMIALVWEDPCTGALVGSSACCGLAHGGCTGTRPRRSERALAQREG